MRSRQADRSKMASAHLKINASLKLLDTVLTSVSPDVLQSVKLAGLIAIARTPEEQALGDSRPQLASVPVLR